MKQNKKKYDELQAKVFLLTEENEQLKARLEEVEADNQDALNFICKLDGPAETLAIEFLTRKLEKVCGQ